MNHTFFLVCNSKRALRVTTNKPNLARSEIAMRVKIEIPGEVFRSPIFDISIDVPNDRVIVPEIQANVCEQEVLE